jgi:hypothetical protein
MPKLKLNHSLKTLKTEQQVVTLIISEIHEQFNGINLETLKNNTQLLKDVMNAVENIITNKKISKKNIVLKVFSELFPTDLNLDQVDDDIEFIWSNKLLKKHTLLLTGLKLLSSVFFAK